MKPETKFFLMLIVIVSFFGGMRHINNAEAKDVDVEAGAVTGTPSFMAHEAETVVNAPMETHAEPADVIISEEVFTDVSTMSEAQIQAFLELHSSFLADYVVPLADYYEWEGESYYEGTWIGPSGFEVDSTGWSASKVIYSVSQWYGINPQVLLTTLQKESSLVTDDPSYHGIVQWSMGFAYTESGIRGACGTETNHNPDGSCAGFAMQMDWAGARMKDWTIWANTAHPDALQYITGSSIEVDGQSVIIQNGAEAALYRYTPHIQKSFQTIYGQWFGA